MPQRQRGRFSYNDYMTYLLRIGQTQQAPARYGRQLRRPYLSLQQRKELYAVKARQKAEAAKEDAIFKHQLRGIEAAQAQTYRIDEDIFKQQLDLRKEVFKRELDKNKTAAGIRSDNELTKLREVQRQQIISAPERKKTERLFQERTKAQEQSNRLQLESFKNENAITMEAFKAQNAQRLSVLNARLREMAALKPKESPLEELGRLKNTGYVTSYGDVLRFWLSKGKKKEDAMDMVGIELQRDAVEVPEPGGFFGYGGASRFDRYKKVFDTTLPRQERAEALLGVAGEPLPATTEKSPEVSATLSRYKSRLDAETQLKEIVRRGVEAGVPINQIMAEEQQWLENIGQAFPDQTSVYHQLLEPQQQKPSVENAQTEAR